MSQSVNEVNVALEEFKGWWRTEAFQNCVAEVLLKLFFLFLGIVTVL